MLPETYAALVSVAAVLVNLEAKPSLVIKLSKITDWQEFTNEAELHGLSVMIGYLAKQHALGLPRLVELQFKALTIRHQRVLQARETVLGDVIDIFERNNIQFALLKGAALSPLIYDPPWLRPMRDIDILVKPTDAQIAQTLLRDIGFKNEDFKTGYLFDHHHLPNSVRQQGGFTISLEVHHDALSGDVDASIRLDKLTDALHGFGLAGSRAYALGHGDTLKHLCHHTFEPAKTIKLGSMIDMVRYANTYANDINWSNLKQTQPRIENTLRCVHALIPLPDNLIDNIGGLQLQRWQPDGIGQGFMPLSQISLLADKKQQLSALFFPSSWWLHIFYVVAPEKNLTLTRLVRHPLTLLKWLFRRYRAARKSKRVAL